MDRLRRFGAENWYWILTALVLLVAVIVYISTPNLSKAADIGEFLSGFSSALAFLWLIVGLRSQAADLSLQRQELGLQRTALERQANELKNASKFASLEQIAAIMDRASRRIIESGLASDHSQILNCWMEGMKHWKEMFESRSASVVSARYTEWLRVEGLARGYLGSLASALKIYLEHHREAEFDSKLPDEEFIYVYSGHLYGAPYLAEYAGSSFMIANFVFMYSPGLEALKVGGMFAISKDVGKEFFKEGALEKMKDDLTKKGIPLPAIVPV